MYESYYFGVIGPGFLNQVPTLWSSMVTVVSVEGFKAEPCKLLPWVLARLCYVVHFVGFGRALSIDGFVNFW